MNKLHTFYAPFVYTDKVDNHPEIKKEYYSKILKYSKEIKEIPNNWRCICKSSFKNNNINLNLFNDFSNIIWNSLDRMLCNVNLPLYPDNSQLKEIWFNYYEKGQFQEAHNHQGPPIVFNNFLHYASFSGIYIFHSDKEEEGPTFYDISVDSNTFLYSSKHTPKVEEGNIIWFPANLMHFVSPALKERITISFNIHSHYKHI